MPVSTEGSAIATEPTVFRAELAREQEHLDRCYRRLDELRERARLNLQETVERATNTPQSVYEREVFASYSRKRLQAVSASEHQLVFGRLDCAAEPEPLYVGRIGLADHAHRRILIDWRAPVGSTFYRATARAPAGVIRRRTLITRRRRVVDLNDDLLMPEQADGLTMVAGEGALLHALMQQRGAFMQDIVATIQADQDEVIRSDPTASVVLTGGPGTGKSIVALHRTAYLMYERSAELERRGVLVVGPGTRFSHYISRVLPSLGETAVDIRSVFDLLEETVAEGREPLEVARTKGSLPMARVLKSYLIASYPDPAGGLGLSFDGRLLRFEPAELRKLRNDALSSVGHGFNAARHQVVRALARRLPSKAGRRRRVPAEELKNLAGQLADDSRVLDAVEALLPHRRAVGVLGQMRQQPDLLLSIMGRHLPPDAARAVVDQMTRSSQVLVGDVPLIDELDWLLGPIPRLRPEPAEEQIGYERFAGSRERLEGVGRTGSGPDGEYGCIVVDEAQDLSPMQWRMLARRGPRATWTVVADPRQATLSAPEELEAAIERTLPARSTLRFTLDINYRTPDGIMDYAARASGVDLSQVRSIRAGTPPRVFRFGASPEQVVAEAARWLRAQPGSGCFIVVAEPDAAAVRAAGGDSEVLWALDAKGLEFDNVVLFRPEAVDVSGPENASLVLIAATRATQRLAVIEGPAAPVDRAAGESYASL